MKFGFEQFLDVPIERVGRFFGDVRNLGRISPPFPRMIINATSTAVRSGASFALQLDFLLFRMHWDSMIDEVEEGRSFTDTSSGTLFHRWKHTHVFTPHGHGSMLVDRIECDPVWWFRPFAWIGVHLMFVYRKRAILKALR